MQPDAYLPDGTPLYFKLARGNGKSMLQLRLYAILMSISDEEFKLLMEEVEKELYN